MHFDSEYILKKLNDQRTDGDLIQSESELLTLLKPKTDDEGNVIADTHIATEDLLTAFSDLRLKLAEHMKLDNALFLFGNGTSMYAGSKDTRDFKLSDYRKEFSDLTTIIDEVGNLNGIEEQFHALITVNAYYRIIKNDVKNQLPSRLFAAAHQ